MLDTKSEFLVRVCGRCLVDNIMDLEFCTQNKNQRQIDYGEMMKNELF